ncbi:MAG: hypothetical protein EBV07_01780 [Proteobacteria bacterium]|nr:hypothetical protein [Pseudomonadota bacterium]
MYLYGILVTTGNSENVNFIGDYMYKSIMLTDKELELLASIIRYYLGEKDQKDNFQVNNAHVLLRHISGVQNNKSTNQIVVYGKSG